MIRLTISKTRDIANIAKVGAYYAPLLEDNRRERKLSDISADAWQMTKEFPLTVDLGESYSIKGFTYSPEESRESIFTYRFRVSENGTDWKEISGGEFSNIKNNPIPQRISFDEAINARYIQVETVSGVDGGTPSIDMKQIGILTN
ncbi:MAG TPA: discoidin domain-containing protein [Aequorivita sp.]|nr:discoidin domain-containing protein [Aequorivita sp.]